MCTTGWLLPELGSGLAQASTTYFGYRDLHHCPVPWTELKKGEIQECLVLFAFLLPSIAVVELLNQTTPCLWDMCFYPPF